MFYIPPWFHVKLGILGIYIYVCVSYVCNADLIQIEPSQAEPDTFPTQLCTFRVCVEFDRFPQLWRLPFERSKAISKRSWNHSQKIYWDSPVVQNCKDESIFAVKWIITQCQFEILRFVQDPQDHPQVQISCCFILFRDTCDMVCVYETGVVSCDRTIHRYLHNVVRWGTPDFLHNGYSSWHSPEAKLSSPAPRNWQDHLRF